MPELPEVETTARGLAKITQGAVIKTANVRRADLRFPLPKNLAGQLTGQSVVQITRRAKYMIIHLSNGRLWIVHLGMSGRMASIDAAQFKQPHKHDHVLICLVRPSTNLIPSRPKAVSRDAGHGRSLDMIASRSTRDEYTEIHIAYNDPRRFGMMDMIASHEMADYKLFRNLGFEPLDAAFTGKALYAAIAGKKSTAIKIAIMDQRVVVGVGNIYASESLYDAGISPKRGAASLSKAECAALVKSIKKILRRAIVAGGSSLRDYVQSDGTLGNFQKEFAVYARAEQSCPKCARTKKPCQIQKITQGGRATFFCPRTQK